jgi:hypothetical protein
MLASAQEGRMDADPVLKETPRTAEPDPVLSSESESRSSKTVQPAITVKESPRDSVQVKVTKPSKATEKEEKEEDPLSFNFMYYIIGKFKLSDIIE